MRILQIKPEDWRPPCGHPNRRREPYSGWGRVYEEDVRRNRPPTIELVPRGAETTREPVFGVLVNGRYVILSS